METRTFNQPVNFARALMVQGVPLISAGLFPGAGKVIFCDPANGSDNNSGRQATEAVATLYTAHELMTAGKNDICVLIGDGGTAATARLSLANAVAADSSATTGMLTWSKNACHLIGLTAPAYNQRARIAPPSGTYTASTFNSATFITVSASGCYFGNFSIFNGFSTGGAAQICVLDSGSRNYYDRVWFGGMGDQESADDAGSRSLKLTGSESVFNRCTFGMDTVTRGAANASVEFSGSSCKRHHFIDCFFPFMCDAATPLGMIVAAAAGSDRWQYFERCKFINAIGSTSTTMSALGTLAASIGGHILLESCVRHGITEWGTDATSRGQMYVLSGGATPNGHTAGESVVTSTS